jgi:hypothetical protein
VVDLVLEERVNREVRGALGDAGEQDEVGPDIEVCVLSEGRQGAGQLNDDRVEADPADEAPATEGTTGTQEGIAEGWRPRTS